MTQYENRLEKIQARGVKERNPRVAKMHFPVIWSTKSVPLDCLQVIVWLN